eukprot:1117611-Rhodomonas_salina.1
MSTPRDNMHLAFVAKDNLHSVFVAVSCSFPEICRLASLLASRFARAGRGRAGEGEAAEDDARAAAADGQAGSNLARHNPIPDKITQFRAEITRIRAES